MRQVCEIAREIRGNWPKVNYAAEPYLSAMETIGGINEMYYADTAKSIVGYFLANATSWRGETAKRIKVELKEMI